MSESQIYEDDFEDTVHSAVSSYKTDDSSSRSSTPTSMSSRLSSSTSTSSGIPSAGTPPNKESNGNGSGFHIAGAATNSTIGRSRPLIRSPETRQVGLSSVSISNDSHVLHVSKIMQVEQLEPERKCLYDGLSQKDTVLDMSETPPGLQPGTYTVNEALLNIQCSARRLSCNSSSMSSSSSRTTLCESSEPVHSSSSEAALSHPKLATTLTPSLQRETRKSEEQTIGKRGENPLGGVRRTVTAQCVESDDDKNVAHVWKQSPMSSSKSSPFIAVTEKGILPIKMPSPPKKRTKRSSNGPEGNVLRRKSKETIKEELPQTRRRDPKRCDEHHSVRRDSRKSLRSETRSEKSRMSPSSPKCQRGRDARNKNERETLRRPMRAVRNLETPATPSSRRSRSLVSGLTLERLKRENRYLRDQVSMRENEGVTVDLLVRIAQEELKYAKSELDELKQSKRALLSEERRWKLMFTQVTKMQPTFGEQHARQVKEGVYNRANVEKKLQEVRNKVHRTANASNHLLERIESLEERIRNEKLTDMKAEEYTALLERVRKNDRKIAKLINETKVSAEMAAYTSDKEVQAGEEDLSTVHFPGRMKMQALLHKLIHEVESKDKQIAACLAMRSGKACDSLRNVKYGNDDYHEGSQSSQSRGKESLNSKGSSSVKGEKLFSNPKLASREVESKSAPLSRSCARENPSNAAVPALTSSGPTPVNYSHQPKQQQPFLPFRKTTEPFFQELKPGGAGNSHGTCLSISNGNDTSDAVSSEIMECTTEHIVREEETPQPPVVTTQSPSLQEGWSNGFRGIEKPCLSPTALDEPRSVTAVETSSIRTTGSTQSENKTLEEDVTTEVEEDLESGRSTPVWLRGF